MKTEEPVKVIKEEPIKVVKESKKSSDEDDDLEYEMLKKAVKEKIKNETVEL